MFHYTKQDGLYGILEKKKLWLVSSFEMNDVTERFYANLFATVELICSDDEDARLLRANLSTKDIININKESLKVQFYSASFCESENNEYLWHNYADGDKGFCIEINEHYFEEQCKIIASNEYKHLDEEDFSEGKVFVEKRMVYYDYPKDLFLNVLRSTKSIYIPNDIDSKCQSENFYKNWFSSMLDIFAGTVKPIDYMKENEVRLLFQNRYDDSFSNEHGIYFINRYCYQDAIEKLGLDEEKNDEKKRRYELNLESFFNEKLIKSITVGNKNETDIDEIKEKMKAAGLEKTILKNRNGNIL